MTWRRRPLSAVAPAMPSNRVIEDKRVWSLTLDQIESHTGQILNKKYIDADSIPPSTHFFDEGNVLYSKLRPYLNKVYVPQECGVATSELVPLRPDPSSLHRKFLSYFLRSHEFLSFATACVAGAKMPRMVMRRMWNYEIPVPHLKEQARIVELLDQADALRKLRRQADDKAARILPALFHHYFGDPQNQVSLSGLTTGDLILETQYGTSQSASASGDGVPVLRMNNIEYCGDLNLLNMKSVELSSHDQNRYKLETGDLLFNRTNSAELVGKVGLWDNEIESAVPASYLIRFRVDVEQVLPEFIWAYMNSDFFKSLLKAKARKAIGMANINAQELRSFPAFKPEMPKQLKFREKFSNLKYVKTQAATSKQKLEDLFQLLLHRAFTGELTAKWREDHLSELVDEMAIQAKG